MVGHPLHENQALILTRKELYLGDTDASDDGLIEANRKQVIGRRFDEFANLSYTLFQSSLLVRRVPLLGAVDLGSNAVDMVQ
jgi:hypothetical protein